MSEYVPDKVVIRCHSLLRWVSQPLFPHESMPTSAPVSLLWGCQPWFFFLSSLPSTCHGELSSISSYPFLSIQDNYHLCPYWFWFCRKLGLPCPLHRPQDSCRTLSNAHAHSLCRWQAPERWDYQTGPLILHVGTQHAESIPFLILESTTSDVILGLPWLKHHNPIISWKTGEIQSWSLECMN